MIFKSLSIKLQFKVFGTFASLSITAPNFGRNFFQTDALKRALGLDIGVLQS
jgi:hypothetical protein